MNSFQDLEMWKEGREFRIEFSGLPHDHLFLSGMKNSLMPDNRRS
jgi:hypothetical protein